MIVGKIKKSEPVEARDGEGEVEQQVGGQVQVGQRGGERGQAPRGHGDQTRG